VYSNITSSIQYISIQPFPGGPAEEDFEPLVPRVKAAAESDLGQHFPPLERPPRSWPIRDPLDPALPGFCSRFHTLTLWARSFAGWGEWLVTVYCIADQKDAQLLKLPATIRTGFKGSRVTRATLALYANFSTQGRPFVRFTLK